MPRAYGPLREGQMVYCTKHQSFESDFDHMYCEAELQRREEGKRTETCNWGPDPRLGEIREES
jgi:hypothetical protein